MSKVLFQKAVCQKCQFFVRFIDIDGVINFLDAELVSIVGLNGVIVKGYRPHGPTCLATRTRAERLKFKLGAKG